MCIRDSLYIVYGRGISHIDALSTEADNWSSTACLQYSELSISIASRANNEMCGDVPGFIGGRMKCLWFESRGVFRRVGFLLNRVGSRYRESEIRMSRYNAREVTVVMSNRRCDRIASVLPNYYLFFVSDNVSVSYTHLTLPTNREV